MEAFAVRVKNEQDVQSAITLFERKELAEGLRIECIHATDDYDCLLSAILEKGFRGFIYAVSNTAVLPLKLGNPVTVTTLRLFRLTRKNVGTQYCSWSIVSGFRWSRPLDFPLVLPTGIRIISTSGPLYLTVNSQPVLFVIRTVELEE